MVKQKWRIYQSKPGMGRGKRACYSSFCEMFREQVNTISSWFDQWNECERTVALYSLIKRVTHVNARFLSLVLDQTLGDSHELQLHEQQANNPGFVSSLPAESDAAIAQLLLHVPLLRPGNNETKARYVTIIHKVLSHTVETGAHIDKARQLLSYSLIHPAFNGEDRRSLTYWLRLLEARITNGTTRMMPPTVCDSPQHQQTTIMWGQQQQRSRGSGGNDVTLINGHCIVHSCNSAPSIASLNKSGFTDAIGNYSSSTHPRVRRSNSLTPPVSITQTSDFWSSQDDLSGRQKPRSFSLSSEHAPPLSPQSSLASSGSGSLDELRSGFISDACGMRDVPSWLKSLRLHKYAQLFAQLSYEEMLALTEEQLAAQGVTKGARHKIIISIRKLRERYNTLCQLEKEVVEGNNLAAALEELKAILLSPIKASHRDDKERDETEFGSDVKITDNGTAGSNVENTGSDFILAPSDSDTAVPDEDIPVKFTKVMGKVCTQLLVSNHTEEETVRLFMWLLDHSLQHEAFTTQQKRRLSSWRLQIQDAWHLSPSQHKASDQRHARLKWHHHSQFSSGTTNGYSHLHGNRGQRFPPPQPIGCGNYHHRGTSAKPGFTLSYPSGPLGRQQQQHCSSLSMLGAGVSFMAKRPSLQDTLPEPLQLHASLQRTRSAPPKPNNFCGLSFGPGTKCATPESNSSAVDPEINSRLESLCLSMTEHALGGCGEV
ncbi:protein Smaug homolog 2 isoform X2 [Zootermopsis nevadensis]|uniref:protein Smaug homolog 2 isoform X2 n=1 Tax=Zootermopsis nevadensis TaxID=136037 RepID=UPI000B8EE89B|nr:protein Smaug homolog 2 isoform X2 [Zootermopsis nevadensis]